MDCSKTRLNNHISPFELCITHNVTTVVSTTFTLVRISIIESNL